MLVFLCMIVGMLCSPTCATSPRQNNAIEITTIKNELRDLISDLPRQIRKATGDSPLRCPLHQWGPNSAKLYGLDTAIVLTAHDSRELPSTTAAGASENAAVEPIQCHQDLVHNYNCRVHIKVAWLRVRLDSRGSGRTEVFFKPITHVMHILRSARTGHQHWKNFSNLVNQIAFDTNNNARNGVTFRESLTNCATFWLLKITILLSIGGAKTSVKINEVQKKKIIDPRRRITYNRILNATVFLTHPNGECSSGPTKPRTPLFPLYLYAMWGVVFIIGLAGIGLIVWVLSKLIGGSTAPKQHEKVRLNEAGCGLVTESGIVQDRVVNGTYARNSFPWTVLVVLKAEGNPVGYGTGALVTPLHVLTAAHLLLTPGNDVFVLYGSNVISLMKNVSVTGIRRVSEGFSDQEDIMLLLLETALTNISRLCVPSWKSNDEFTVDPSGDFPKAGDNIFIAGFGSLSEKTPGEGGESPRELMYTRETVLPNSYCETDTEGFDSKTAFCAKTPNTGICRGDSGASAMLLINRRLISVGIAASSRLCGFSPDRYIRVAVYLEWLHTSINESPKDFTVPL